MQSNEKKLFLLDAFALIFRSYYAFIRNPMVNSKGLNTSAIFGFTNTLLEILQKENPTHIAVAFDPPSPTFRHDMYPEYKANRDETPEDIIKAVPYIKQILEALNIPIVEEFGFEADDVIGTLAKKAEKEGYITYMVTPDKDYCQLVSPTVKIFKPRKGGNDIEIWGVQEVNENFEIAEPSQVIDVLALWGDSSDNVPGAPGIGEKTAKKLISEYYSVENIFEHLNELKGKQKETFENFKSQILLSKQLVTIKIDVPVKESIQSFELNEPNRSDLEQIFQELEFRNMLNRVFGSPQPAKKKEDVVQGNLFGMAFNEIPVIESPQYKTIDDIDTDYYCAASEAELQTLLHKLLSSTEFCFDTETTSLDVIHAELVGISFSFKKNEAFYVPIPAKRDEAEKILSLLKPYFENPAISKVGQNIKYDMHLLANYGIELNGTLFDTMLAHYLLEPEQKHNLDFLAGKYLGYQPIPIENLIGNKGRAQILMRQVPLEKITVYACEDADLTLQLKEIFSKSIAKNNMSELLNAIETPLVKVLMSIEKAGFTIDTEALFTFSKELTKELYDIDEQIIKHVGYTFNIDSPKQLGDILFDRLKISADVKMTSKSKQYSTSEETLQAIADKHPIIPLILEHRSLKKLLSTYVEALPALVDKSTGKVHTSFNQAITATGRLSSTNPNLQNIPIREARGREIRKAFIPSDSQHKIISADYSQIELRLMAHLSGDENMLEAFNKGEDIHAATAAKINKIPLSEVSRDMRSSAKTANFGIIYGISAFGLSQRLNVSRTDAKQLIDGYFETFPQVKEYMDASIQKAREKGYVETLLGRRRQLPDILSRNATVRGFAERNAINAPIQGTAADIIKIAMINIYQKLKEGNYKTQMILQVHDELVFNVPLDELDAMKMLIKEEMEKAYTLKVPLDVDLGNGNNWLEAH